MCVYYHDVVTPCVCKGLKYIRPIQLLCKISGLVVSKLDIDQHQLVLTIQLKSMILTMKSSAVARTLPPGSFPLMTSCQVRRGEISSSGSTLNIGWNLALPMNSKDPCRKTKELLSSILSCFNETWTRLFERTTMLNSVSIFIDEWDIIFACTIKVCGRSKFKTNRRLSSQHPFWGKKNVDALDINVVRFNSANIGASEIIWWSFVFQPQHSEARL